MRTAVLILGLLGAAASSMLAITWLNQYGAERTEMEPFAPLIERSERLTERFELIETRVRAGYALIASVVLSALGIALLFSNTRRLAAIPLVIAGVIPGFFAPQVLIFCGLTLLAGLLALAIPRLPLEERSYRTTDSLTPHP